MYIIITTNKKSKKKNYYEKRVMRAGIEPATPGLGVQGHIHEAIDFWEGGIEISFIKHSSGTTTLLFR